MPRLVVADQVRSEDRFVLIQLPGRLWLAEGNVEKIVQLLRLVQADVLEQILQILLQSGTSLLDQLLVQIVHLLRWQTRQHILKTLLQHPMQLVEFAVTSVDPMAPGGQVNFDIVDRVATILALDGMRGWYENLNHRCGDPLEIRSRMRGRSERTIRE